MSVAQGPSRKRRTAAGQQRVADLFFEPGAHEGLQPQPAFEMFERLDERAGRLLAGLQPPGRPGVEAFQHAPVERRIGLRLLHQLVDQRIAPEFGVDLRRRLRSLLQHRGEAVDQLPGRMVVRLQQRVVAQGDAQHRHLQPGHGDLGDGRQQQVGEHGVEQLRHHLDDLPVVPARGAGGEAGALAAEQAGRGVALRRAPQCGRPLGLRPHRRTGRGPRPPPAVLLQPTVDAAEGSLQIAAVMAATPGRRRGRRRSRRRGPWRGSRFRRRQAVEQALQRGRAGHLVGPRGFDRHRPVPFGHAARTQRLRAVEAGLDALRFEAAAGGRIGQPEPRRERRRRDAQQQPTARRRHLPQPARRLPQGLRIGLGAERIGARTDMRLAVQRRGEGLQFALLPFDGVVEQHEGARHLDVGLDLRLVHQREGARRFESGRCRRQRVETGLRRSFGQPRRDRLAQRGDEGLGPARRLLAERLGQVVAEPQFLLGGLDRQRRIGLERLQQLDRLEPHLIDQRRRAGQLVVDEAQQQGGDRHERVGRGQWTKCSRREYRSARCRQAAAFEHGATAGGRP